MSCRTRLNLRAATVLLLLLLLCRAPGWPHTGDGHKTQLPSSVRGEIPADKNTFPAFYLSDMVSSEEQRAFPSRFREHTVLQHQEQN